MATHSSSLAWRISWTEEPVHRVAKSQTWLKWLSMQECPYIHRHPFGAPVRSACPAGHHSGQPAPCPNSPRTGHQTTRSRPVPRLWNDLECRSSASRRPRGPDRRVEPLAHSSWSLGPLSGPGTSPVVRTLLRALLWLESSADLPASPFQ